MIPIQDIPVFIGIVLLLVSCEISQTTNAEQSATTTHAPIKKLDTLPVSSSTTDPYFKIKKLEKEYIDSPLVDSILILGIKSGITQKELDNTIISKSIPKKSLKEDNKTYEYYELEVFSDNTNIYSHAFPYIHPTCGLAGFDLNFFVKNDHNLSEQSQILIDWGNGAKKEGDKRLVSGLISNYQNTIIAYYESKYGKPNVDDVNNKEKVWFIGRKEVKLSLVDFITVMETYEENKIFHIANASYQDLKLMKLYIEACKKDFNQKLNI